MRAIIYNRISDQKQDVEFMNENGCNFIVCNRCGGTWIVNTLSREKLIGRKRYPKPKCPTCD
jgi:Zn-finger nucleic acid-binding protein